MIPTQCHRCFEPCDVSPCDDCLGVTPRSVRERKEARELFEDAAAMAFSAYNLYLLENHEAAWARLESAAFYHEHARCALRRAGRAAREESRLRELDAERAAERAA